MSRLLEHRLQKAQEHQVVDPPLSLLLSPLLHHDLPLLLPFLPELLLFSFSLLPFLPQLLLPLLSLLLLLRNPVLVLLLPLLPQLFKLLLSLLLSKLREFSLFLSLPFLSF